MRIDYAKMTAAALRREEGRGSRDESVDTRDESVELCTNEQMRGDAVALLAAGRAGRPIRGPGEPVAGWDEYVAARLTPHLNRESHMRVEVNETAR
ncbi:MAG TPA: hypothetical protein VHY36_15630, partial [Steroidobacteraceae bacterium]|nr:hypothetical protein [Steroidobacteraceae bacterium]